MKIFIAKNPAEAHIVCGLLQSENLSCEVRGEGLFGLKGELPFTEETDPYVFLHELKHVPTAQRLIDEYQAQRSSKTYNDWVCSNCRESNEAQFGSCWQCGTLSPSDSLIRIKSRTD